MTYNRTRKLMPADKWEARPRDIVRKTGTLRADGGVAPKSVVLNYPAAVQTAHSGKVAICFGDCQPEDVRLKVCDRLRIPVTSEILTLETVRAREVSTYLLVDPQHLDCGYGAPAYTLVKH